MDIRAFQSILTSGRAVYGQDNDIALQKCSLDKLYTKSCNRLAIVGGNLMSSR